jgi:hypothetical protein
MSTRRWFGLLSPRTYKSRAAVDELIAGQQLLIANHVTELLSRSDMPPMRRAYINERLVMRRERIQRLEAMRDQHFPEQTT